MNPKFDQFNHRSDHQGFEPGPLSTRQVLFHYATRPLLFFNLLHSHLSQKRTSVATLTTSHKVPKKRTRQRLTSPIPSSVCFKMCLTLPWTTESVCRTRTMRFGLTQHTQDQPCALGSLCQRRNTSLPANHSKLNKRTHRYGKETRRLNYSDRQSTIRTFFPIPNRNQMIRPESIQNNQ